jgi:hypothetical protein
VLGVCVRVPIGERVREAHLSHYCPGGSSLPVTTSRPIGLDLELAAPPPSLEAAARAGGQACVRCEQPIAADQDARRRASGGWVHEDCPRG